MSASSERVKKWRKETKLRIIESMGHSCQICGYNRCPEAMDLHHINPMEKEFGLGKIMANPQSWEKIIIPELRKCILLCSNCHREYHSGFVSLPQDFCKFNEDYSVLKTKIEETPCECCNTLKPHHQRFCSRACAKSIRACKYDWHSIGLKDLLDQEKSYYQIAKLVGCSGNSVKNAAKRMGLI